MFECRFFNLFNKRSVQCCVLNSICQIMENIKSRKILLLIEEVADVAHVQEVADESAKSTSGSAFSCRQSPHRSLSRTDLHLPSPNKKVEIIQTWATKYILTINLQRNRGTPRKILNDKEKIWLIELLDMSDISYVNFVYVYIVKFDGESKYKQKKILLWPIASNSVSRQS